jgi:hypothetical protein
MSERMRKIEDLVPADIEAERLLALAPALRPQWGVVVIDLSQFEEEALRSELVCIG